MSRSLKKGPYINVKLEKKVLAMNESGKKSVIKTWARASVISVINSSLFTSLRTWWDTNSESSPSHAHSAAMQATGKSKSGTLKQK